MSTMVSYNRISDSEHLLDLESLALPDIRIDYRNIPEAEKGGTAVKLLGAACLYCFAATLGSALTARGAEISSMIGQVVVIKGKDEIRRTKIIEIDILIEVEIDDKYESVLEKCKKIMEKGCLLTYTLEDAIEIEYQIIRKV